MNKLIERKRERENKRGKTEFKIHECKKQKKSVSCKTKKKTKFFVLTMNIFAYIHLDIKLFNFYTFIKLHYIFNIRLKNGISDINAQDFKLK